MLKSLLKHIIFFPILYKAVRSWQKSVELNAWHAKWGCFEGPYSYSADLHWTADAGKRSAKSLYRLYTRKMKLS